MRLGRLFTFLAVLSSILFGVHYYLWLRLIRDPALPEVWSVGLTLALAALALSIPVGMFVSHTASRSRATPFAWVAYLWMGVMFVLLCVLLPLEPIRLGVVSSEMQGAERLTLLRVMAGSAATLGLALSGAGLLSALSRVGVKSVRIPLTKLAPELSGYRIVQMSDIHVGPTIGREFLEGLVSTCNALSPDLIVITGDLVDGSVTELGHLVQPLADLRAKDGVFFVTGNHEYYSGADEWITRLRELGIRVLRNERVPIRGASGFDLAGVDDITAHQFGAGHGQDVQRALQGRDPARAVVLLAHQPKTVEAARLAGVDLQLSGHTHGGQIWPWGYAVRLDQPYVQGLHDHGDTKIYVSPGTGYWGPPMRIAVPAEITRIELVAAKSDTE